MPSYEAVHVTPDYPSTLPRMYPTDGFAKKRKTGVQHLKPLYGRLGLMSLGDFSLPMIIQEPISIFKT